ncbi:hypothetical protein DCAR_0104670 [Daucus carota subsp. sativus]|uniref:Uncharacterized protein n=1 Tax=Daucus carota subsp. sativus TaxID=79200 RepID=A0A166J0A7_DAUCS|nr:PREDICTED: pelargonidin 3-O-(6-caffeoylglucoside) 5-O-(6-O-malonylglucoside) 4'''-malonyltransferase-like [Daucus carota subsp. sativus]WOG85481.1 hypothetical protein DCAR_0104670 [Daucus carota subsp. sativus]
MKVEILSKEIIKPCTPTPPSLSTYNLSLMDELAPNLNVPTIFYYSAPDQESADEVALRYKHLKTSLSKILTTFYPFAGRYRAESYLVDCSDQGAEYVEAKVDIRLDDLVSQRTDVKAELLNELLPYPIGAIDEYEDPLLAVQVSGFSCGGFAIGICSSHRIADVSTTIAFVNAWATAAKQELGQVDESYVPEPYKFDSASLLPGLKLMAGLPSGMSRDKENFEVHKVSTKMFYFPNSTISSIQERARLNDSSKLPSRVQSVFGIIGKTIVDLHVADLEEPKGYILTETVNIRGKTNPPLHKNQFGNLYQIAHAQGVASPKTGVELSSYVDDLSKSVKKAMNFCGMLTSGKEGQTAMTNEFFALLKNLSAIPDIYFVGMFTSWCTFPFYEADFGWGKPVWFSVANVPMKNTVVLIDDKSGEGIEAWVNLDETDMQKFIAHSNIADLDLGVEPSVPHPIIQGRRVM